MKHTPENITSLQPNEVFVFGSNESGYHGGGAARYALENFGAIYGKGTGLQGQSYALPTKDYHVETLPIPAIKIYVDVFFAFAKTRPDLTFYMTLIGCGLAGLTVAEIAPLFKGYQDAENVILPKEFTI